MYCPKPTRNTAPPNRREFQPEIEEKIASTLALIVSSDKVIGDALLAFLNPGSMPVAPDDSKPDDSSLVERAQDGDRDAFEMLVERYQDKVYSICYGKLKDEQDSMDVSQDVFVKVFRYLENFNQESSFYTWLYRITVNTCIDYLRKQSRVAQVDYDDTIKRDEDVEGNELLMPSKLGVNPDKAFSRKELREEMLEALESLSEKHRTILNLREVEGLSYKEMAEVLDISKGTVMSRLYHARQYFQDALDEYLDESPTEQ